MRFEGYEMALKSFAEYLDREYFKKGPKYGRIDDDKILSSFLTVLGLLG